MDLYDLKTTGALAGTVVGGTMILVGSVYDSLRESLILSGVFITLFSILYCIWHTCKLYIHPDI